MKYFTSDWHYGHKNICMGTSSWPNKEINCRNFKTIEEMNRALIDSINDTVGQDDELYNLGDVVFGGIENLWRVMSQIYCKKIYLAPGNHDKHIKNNVILPNCHFDPKSQMIVDGPNLTGDKDNDVRAKELFELVSQDMYLTYKGVSFHLYHHPIEEWEEMGHGGIHLHGHVHNKMDNNETNTKYRRKDVCWKEGKIYSIEEIYDEMMKREIKPHH